MRETTCRDVREWILSADPAELRADAGPLAGHLAACRGCARVAQAVLDGLDRLDRELADVRPATSPEAIARMAMEAPRETTERSRRRRVVMNAAPLAAAAMLALVLLTGRQLDAPADAQPTELPVALRRPEPATRVTVRASSDLTLFQTDGDLTIAWIHGRE